MKCADSDVSFFFILHDIVEREYSKWMDCIRWIRSVKQILYLEWNLLIHSFHSTFFLNVLFCLKLIRCMLCYAKASFDDPQLMCIIISMKIVAHDILLETPVVCKTAIYIVCNISKILEFVDM